jgi:lipopolysaccharide/colanic/teichoic acid biosynthesis glycosyltransferase
MLKRSFDIAIAVTASILLAPFFCLIAILIRLKMGRPILFRQLRPGKDGRGFMMLKFRTMRDAYGSDGQPLSDGERLTKFGKFLRSTSLDELPELWNVLKGDMSLVGPRPLLIEYIPLYSSRQMRRHDVRPGITGWAQVNGRNALSWEDKFALDVWYVDHQSFWLDMRILLLTIGKVVKREGISGAGEATMSRFEGSKP